MKTITYEQLVAKHACIEQLNKFEELFGTNVEVTEEACKTVAQEFDWRWAAENLLSIIAEKQYDEAYDIAWEQYNEAQAIAWEQYDEAQAIAWEQYDEARVIAEKQYEEARAIAFAKAYLGMPE